MIEPIKCKIKDNATERQLIDNGFQNRLDYYRLKKTLYSDKKYGDMIFAYFMVNKSDNWLVVNVIDNNGNTYAPFYNPDARHDNLVAEAVIENYNMIIDKLIANGIMEKEKNEVITNKKEIIKIKYHSDIEKLDKIDGNKSDWIDLRVAEKTFIPQGEFKLVSLGVSMKLPEGYEAHIVPRSSTFKNFGIIQTNHCGVIDNSYSGNEDIWKFPAYCIEGKNTVNGKRGTLLKKNDRICQFRIMKKQPDILFEEVSFLGSKNRGGFGSTGK